MLTSWRALGSRPLDRGRGTCAVRRIKRMRPWQRIASLSRASTSRCTLCVLPLRAMSKIEASIATTALVHQGSACPKQSQQPSMHLLMARLIAQAQPPGNPITTNIAREIMLLPTSIIGTTKCSIRERPCKTRRRAPCIQRCPQHGCYLVWGRCRGRVNGISERIQENSRPG